jgi:hypothetical protein
VQSPSGTGSAIYSVDNIDSYLYVHPKAGAGAQSTAPRAVWPVAVGAAAGVLVVVAVVLLRRRRSHAEE